MNFTISMRDL